MKKKRMLWKEKSDGADGIPGIVEGKNESAFLFGFPQDAHTRPSLVVKVRLRRSSSRSPHTLSCWILVS